MKKITYDTLLELLEEILDCGAFELHSAEEIQGKREFYIPYMMNDALECYLLFPDGRLTGTYHADAAEEMTVELIETEQGPALIFHQGETNVFTLWFRECFQVLNCYRYDQIGHFWVKGQEQWRRLVYIIGTIHDKYNYMGDSVCNEQERKLLPLMEFAPFRYFSPIREPLDEYYTDSERGFECMKELVKEAGDRHFLRLLSFYKAVYGILPFRRAAVRLLAEAMQKAEREKLYQLLFEKVQAASGEYPERSYPENMKREMESSRAQVSETLKRKGFSGEYPLFQRKQKGKEMQILAMEEHPFTVLESEQYCFRIQFMVSEMGCGEKAEKPEKRDLENRNQKNESPKRTRWNSGFFTGRENRGWIARDLDFL